MDVSKVKAAIDAVHVELNSVIDAEFKVRNLGALRTFSLVAAALELADTHLNKAVKQTERKAAKAGVVVAEPAPVVAPVVEQASEKKGKK